MDLISLLNIAGIECLDLVEPINITKVVSDSRCICEGCLYVCVRGIHNDGHRFINDAIKAGAAAVVAEKGALVDKCNIISCIVIEVTNSRKALACLCDAWYGLPSSKMKFIAVTGTNGKTTVTHILKKIFETALYRCGLIGTISCLSMDRQLFSDNFNPLANMTTPDPEQLYYLLSQMVNDGVEYVFIEASSHALELDKLFPIHFSASVFTNLTPDHLDFHGDMDKYVAAKKKLFKMSDLAVVNMDSKYYNDIVKACVGRVVSCSELEKESDYFANNVVDCGINGFSYTMSSSETIIKLKSHLPGSFNVMNTLQAAVCAFEMGISPIHIVEAISSVTGIDGRMEKIKLSSNIAFSVFIDYAHTPDALDNLLKSVREFCSSKQRLIVVFGCGGGRDKSKRPIMGEIATRLADFVVITSDNCRDESPNDIIEDILSGVSGRKNYKIIADRRIAIEQTIRSAKPNDVIILAGKGHEQYEINQNGKVPFSEKNIVLNVVDNI